MTRLGGPNFGAVAHFGGRPLCEWVPSVVAQLAAASDPLQVILFGSAARAEDGPTPT